MGGPELSIVIPVFNEEAVLPALVERLRSFADGLTPLLTEIILVDDHSADRSPALLREVCRNDTRFRYARLARNGGSHVAILAGLAQARGDCAVFLAVPQDCAETARPEPTVPPKHWGIRHANLMPSRGNVIRRTRKTYFYYALPGHPGAIP